MITNPKARLGCCPEGSCVDEAVIRAPLDAEIERLQAALKPFVAFGQAYPRPRIAVSAEDTIIVSARDCHITLADVDRAAQVLEQKEDKS